MTMSDVYAENHQKDPPERMTSRQFWDACNHFDWFYEMSDDASVWRKGEAAQALLLTHAPAGSENRRIWDGFTAHHYSGEPWKTDKKPKPERP